jgi:hypothetical protein
MEPQKLVKRQIIALSRGDPESGASAVPARGLAHRLRAAWEPIGRRV